MSIFDDFRATIRFTTGEVKMTPQVESEYLAHKSRLVLQQRRLAMFLAVVLWTGFTYWDFAHHRHFLDFYFLIAMRTTGTVILVALFASAFTKQFLSEVFAEAVLMVATTLAWACILVMMLVSPAPNNYLDYYAGLPLMYVYLFSFLWIRVSKALVLGLVLAVAFNLVEWWMYSEWERYVPPDQRETYQTAFQYYWGTASSYITAFLILGAIVCNQLDRSLRINFLRERELHQQTKEREAQSIQLINLKEQQVRQATEQNEKKSGFLAAAAHDIRQPLMAVGANMEALEHWVETGDLAAAGKSVHDARVALRSLRSTLNGVLEISQLESGAVDPKYSRFEMGEFIEEVCRPLIVLAGKRGVSLRLRLPKTPVFVQSDYGLLARVLGNLVGNAIKYTAAHAGRRSEVLVGLVRLGNRVRVDVYDTGIGISRQHRDSIFQPFFQVDNKGRDREKGLGLGLSIVAQITELLDEHRLDFASNPGRGSRFSVEVPTAADQTIQEIPGGVENDASGDSVSVLRGSYVLIVEDDALVSRGLVAALETWDILAESCRDMKEVSEFLRSSERNLELILTDFALPEGRTGYDVISAVRLFCRSEVPAVILTGELNFLRRDDIPVSAILSKPAEMKVLKRVLASALRASAQSQAS